jgi:hypothetical protein
LPEWFWHDLSHRVTRPTGKLPVKATEVWKDTNGVTRMKHDIVNGIAGDWVNGAWCPVKHEPHKYTVNEILYHNSKSIGEAFELIQTMQSAIIHMEKAIIDLLDDKLEKMEKKNG